MNFKHECERQACSDNSRGLVIEFTRARHSKLPIVSLLHISWPLTPLNSASGPDHVCTVAAEIGLQRDHVSIICK